MDANTFGRLRSPRSIHLHSCLELHYMVPSACFACHAFRYRKNLQRDTRRFFHAVVTAMPRLCMESKTSKSTIAAMITIFHFLSAVVVESCRYFNPADPAISYPYMEGTISGSALAIMIIVIPIGTFLLATLMHRSLADIHHAGLTLLEGFALVLGFKRWVSGSAAAA